MKLIPALLTAAALIGSSAAYAADNPTVKTAKAAYTCQGGKKITVTYGFNRQGLPTYASAKLGGKTRKLPINLDRSDAVGTVFGNENGYSLSAAYTDSGNFRRNSAMIFSPAQEILFKECNAR